MKILQASLKIVEGSVRVQVVVRLVTELPLRFERRHRRMVLRSGENVSKYFCLLLFAQPMLYKCVGTHGRYKMKLTHLIANR